MKTKRLAFALFAAAILFSMVREWNAPAVCEFGSRYGRRLWLARGGED